MPPSVRYARALLSLQACIWGLICVLASVNANQPQPWFDPALTFSAAAVAGALAAAKGWLGHRIPRGSTRTRQLVIVVESVMAYIGVTLPVPLAVPQGGVILALPCLVGGGLSLIAVIALMGPTARQYFAPWCGEVANANAARRPDDGSSAPFWRLTPGVPVAC